MNSDCPKCRHVTTVLVCRSINSDWTRHEKVHFLGVETRRGGHSASHKLSDNSMTIRLTGQCPVGEQEVRQGRSPTHVGVVGRKWLWSSGY